MSSLQDQLVKVCQRLASRNFLAAADGNVSFKVSDEQIIITPTGLNKAYIEPSDLAVITLDNRVLKGKPSSERLMHLEVYRKCPEAKAVVHAHPPTAIAWSVAFPDLIELPSESLSEVILAVGRIPIVPYARPSTQDMGNHLHAFLPQCRVMILARHGALSWGEDLEEAYNGMERLEHSAHILRLAHTLRGSLTQLPSHEVEALRKMRDQMGNKSL